MFTLPRGVVAVGGVSALCALGLLAVRTPLADAPIVTWTVDRGDVVTDLVAPGTLRAARSLTYRSPVNGRELEIVHLALEGLHVAEGDLLARLETRDLEADLRQAENSVHDVAFARQVADLELLEATASYNSTVDGEDALTLEESRTNLALTEKKVDRLRREVQNLEPLLDQGFITGDELERSQSELESVEAELTLARRRASVLSEQTYPLNQRRAELQLAQKRAQRDGVNRRLAAARRYVTELAALIEACDIYADAPGLVVYEEFMASSPRRKIRLGDRVTPSQGILRVVEVSRMLVDTWVPERSVHRVEPGQSVLVRVEAFPQLVLSGRVNSIGVLARTTRDRMTETKRFDVAVELEPTVAELRPEMTARVDIRVGERQDVLRLPVSALFERDGMVTVNVLRRRQAETRQVELGEQNERFVEVVAGVVEGDRVTVVDSPGGGESGPLPVDGVDTGELGFHTMGSDNGDLGLGPAR